MTHLDCKTIGLTATLTTLLLAGPVQTASARDQTTFGFYVGVNDYDSRWYHYHNDKRRGHHRHYHGPRHNYSSRYRWRYYDRDRDYPYRYRHYDSDRVIATATGIFFGVLIGSEIIRYMNDVDRLRTREANVIAMTAPVGSRISWRNPQSYNYGSITPTRDGYSDSGKYCREFYQTVVIGDRTQDAYGVACQYPDGAWHIIQ